MTMTDKHLTHCQKPYKSNGSVKCEVFERNDMTLWRAAFVQCVCVSEWKSK